MRKNIFFLPVSLPFFIVLLALPFVLLAVSALLEWSPGVALQKALGLSVFESVLLYLTILAGGVVNLPVFEFKSKRDSEQRHVSYLGRKYPLPVWHGHNTVVSVNLGGAVFALLAAVYFVLPLQPLTVSLSIVIVTLGVFLLAKPSRSVGYYVPAPVPPLLATGVALLGLYLNGGGLYNCARLAFVSGVAGTLIATALLNVLRRQKLSASSFSVGGFGAFDGIFLTGVLSTVVACFFV
ncbi:MAG: hypothetical protein A4E28_01058 [Methanocella sp. PtaU1.Bin125]|nr:MAG: hypothetical protein A4E28_01058 [Methanocella sp. PtaU1.Bin125]